MRTLGRPSRSTVATAIASGSLGSLRRASSNQPANRRSGSAASAKSPLFNQPGCFIEAVSDIWRSGVVAGVVPHGAGRRSGYNGTDRVSIWRRLLPAAALALALPTGACSYQLGSMFGSDAPQAGKGDITGSD